MYPSRAGNGQAGFTLVELVTVIVILGILSVGTVSFIVDSTGGFAAAGRRTELGSGARVVVERMSRELRNALPNSVRVAGGGTCIEHVPVIGATSYMSLPVGVAGTTFFVAPPLATSSLTNARVAVYPDDTASVYTLSASSPVSPTVTLSAPDVSNRVTVTMAAAHMFPSESPGNRLFFVGMPVSYCAESGRLFRYSGYGFATTQRVAAALPAALPDRSPIGDTLAPTTIPFTVAGGTLTRNAQVKLDLDFSTAEERVRLNHVVQLRNVP